MFDPGKQLGDVRGTQFLRECSALLQMMTRLDGIAGELLLLEDEDIKEPFDRMQSPIDGRGRQTLVMLLRNKAIDVSPGDLPQGLVNRSKEQAKIQAVALNRVVCIVPHAQVLTEEIDFPWMHPSPPQTGLTSFNPLHGLVILVSFRRVIEWGVSQRDVD
jgi:hypothetical protein